MHSPRFFVVSFWKLFRLNPKVLCLSLLSSKNTTEIWHKSNLKAKCNWCNFPSDIQTSKSLITNTPTVLSKKVILGKTFFYLNWLQVIKPRARQISLPTHPWANGDRDKLDALSGITLVTSARGKESIVPHSPWLLLQCPLFYLHKFLPPPLLYFFLPPLPHPVLARAQMDVCLLQKPACLPTYTWVMAKKKKNPNLAAHPFHWIPSFAATVAMAPTENILLGPHPH